MADPLRVDVVSNADRTRLTDARLLVVFLVLMVILGGAGTYVKVQLDRSSNFRQLSAANCERNRSNTLNFNAFVTRLQRVVLATPTLTEREKRTRIEFYQAGKQVVPRCPLPPSGRPERGESDPPSPPPTEPLRLD